MKRTHKYRNWCKRTKTYPKILRLSQSDNGPINIIEVSYNNKESHLLFNDNLNLEEFTGELDKDGSEIYENDIVNGCSFNGSYRYGVVTFIKGRFCVVGIGRFSEGTDEITNPSIKVIGNINQNEDLL